MAVILFHVCCLFFQDFYQLLVRPGLTFMALPATFQSVMAQWSVMKASERACPTGQCHEDDHSDIFLMRGKWEINN